MKSCSGVHACLHRPVIKSDAHGENISMGDSGLRALIGRMLLRLIFRDDIVDLGLHHRTIWFVLEKNESTSAVQAVNECAD